MTSFCDPENCCNGDTRQPTKRCSAIDDTWCSVDGLAKIAHMQPT